ncbi:DUF1573 domain-containing protein [Candidatus Daviesbacteria bacterium]|nr:DUF1573 domain-containing protein [Candidatus Daviesbacteria bacterium]
MNKQFLIISLVITSAILAGGVFIISATSTPTPTTVTSQEGSASIDQLTHDWGQIPYSGGDVKKTFVIKNTGRGTLTLRNVQTSCMCTTAQLTIEGKNSPSFRMHSSSSWVGEVPPGKEAALTVTFDPDFHGPSGVGAINRLIDMDTNDPAHPKLEFSLNGVVVK